MHANKPAMAKRWEAESKGKSKPKKRPTKRKRK
jgi:hypothetical protein